MLTIDQITPIKDQVLVLPDPVKTVTAGGIHIPETVNANNPNYYTMTGVVVRTGQGRIENGERVPVAVKAGDRIVFWRYCGKQIEVETEVFLPDAHDPALAAVQNERVLTQRHRVLMMRESDVMGLAEGEYVAPGYVAPKWSATKGTARPGEDGYVAPANMVQR